MLQDLRSNPWQVAIISKLVSLKMAVMTHSPQMTGGFSFDARQPNINQNMRTMDHLLLFDFIHQKLNIFSYTFLEPMGHPPMLKRTFEIYLLRLCLPHQASERYKNHQVHASSKVM